MDHYFLSEGGGGGGGGLPFSLKIVSKLQLADKIVCFKVMKRKRLFVKQKKIFLKTKIFQNFEIGLDIKVSFSFI